MSDSNYVGGHLSLGGSNIIQYSTKRFDLKSLQAKCKVNGAD